MNRVLRHGCLLSFFFAPVALHAGDDALVQLQHRVFELDYSVAESAQPLETVQLWYTQNDGATWQLYGLDEDRQSPVTVQAPAEGEYGFFFVLVNATGASSPAPAANTTPHVRAFVDFTPPVVQLHDLRQTTSLGQRILQVQWTAIDTNLVSRPVQIEYRRPPATGWMPATPEPLTNTGRFDWRLPAELSGAVSIRLSVSDLGGHRVHSEIRDVEVAPLAYPSATSETNRPYLAAQALNVPEVSARARGRAGQLLAEAMELREAGELRDGISRLREAVRLDPQLTEAFAEMGELLYLLGDLDRSLNAYELALKQQPGMRSALQGAARVYRRQNRYMEAAASLRSILEQRPNDAEIWMNLGDIAVYQGDELMARECYTRATEVEPPAEEIIAKAQKRLTLMAELSRGYQRGGDRNP